MKRTETEEGWEGKPAHRFHIPWSIERRIRIVSQCCPRIATREFYHLHSTRYQAPPPPETFESFGYTDSRTILIILSQFSSLRMDEKKNLDGRGEWSFRNNMLISWCEFSKWMCDTSALKTSFSCADKISASVQSRLETPHNYKYIS